MALPFTVSVGERSKAVVEREFEMRVRYVGETVVLFRDKYTVVVQQGSTCIAFHRWWDRHRGDFARSWKPFCECLTRSRRLDLAECRRLALKYGVEMQAYHQPIGKLDGIKIIGGRKDRV